MTFGLILTSFGLGLRHGVDWDHIAAIADLTSSASDRRRGFFLSLWYAIGHAVVVLALGILAITFESAIPDGLDAWMGRIVGATLLFLGVFVLYELARGREAFRLRSRWMLIIDGTFAGMRKVRSLGGRRQIEVEHDHDHDHGDIDDHTIAPAHDHAHESAHQIDAIIDERVDAPALQPAGTSSAPAASTPHHAHRHAHQHRLELRTEGGAGAGVAGGIGVLHGIGIESPTQIAIFVASTSVAGQQAGLALLVAWVVGLIVANAGLAIAAGAGLLSADSSSRTYRILAFVVAVASIAMGVLYLQAG